MIRPLETRDLDTIAMIESLLFQRPLSRGDLEQMRARPASRGFVFEDAEAAVTSYALFMNAGASADLVSLGTDLKAQRAGLASRLLTSALQDLAGEGVEEVILEVAVDNIAALALYKRSGFIEAARRAGYYRRSNGTVDAIVMRRNLAQGSA